MSRLDPALLLRSSAYTSERFHRVCAAMKVFGLYEVSQHSKDENTGALCVKRTSPLHLLFPALLRLCFYVKSHLHMMHWN